MSDLFLHSVIRFRRTFPVREGFSTLLDPVLGFFSPNFAWMRTWNNPYEPTPESFFVGLPQPAEEKDPWGMQYDANFLFPGEQLIPTIGLSVCDKVDCRDAVLAFLDTKGSVTTRIELRGQVGLHVGEQESTHHRKYLRKVWVDAASPSCFLLEIDLACQMEDESDVGFEVSVFSSASVWFQPYDGSRIHSVISAKNADDNLGALTEWLQCFVLSYQDHVVETTVHFGARSVVRDQEERVRRAFAVIPNMVFSLG